MSNSVEWRQYICRACGLIYVEKDGDPDSGLEPGTRFEDIPDDWECPLCGVTKSDFELFTKEEFVSAPKTISYSNEIGIIIIGGGISGWAVVEEIRKLDAEIPVTLITACDGNRYHKPELSVAMSRNMIVETIIQENSEQSASRHRIQLITKTHVVGISTHNNQLRTTRGTFKYTNLVIAQGSDPFLPKQIPSNSCWRINNLEAWAGLSKELSKKIEQQVVIVGAGMIGCELAEDINKAGHKVTMINRDPFPLVTLLPEIAANYLVEALENLDIVQYSNSEISMISKNDDGKKVILLDNGTTIEYDQLIVATGLVTDNRLAIQAGIEFDNGIAVNPKNLQTSHENIYALGDCISIKGNPCRFVEPIQKQASSIASSILELNPKKYEHISPIIRLKTRSIPIVIRGLPDTNLEWEIVLEKNNIFEMQQRLNQKIISTLSLDLSKLRKAA